MSLNPQQLKWLLHNPNHSKTIVAHAKVLKKTKRQRMSKNAKTFKFPDPVFIREKESS